MHHIAIVGAGAAAVSVLAGMASAVAEHTPQPLSVTIYAPEDTGPGLAYGAHNPASFICNHEIHLMGAAHPSPEEQGTDGFSRWCAKQAGTLRTRYPHTDFTDGNAYAPRACYGEYLKDCFAASCDQLTAAGVNVRILRMTVWEVTCTDDGIILRSQGGAKHYDAALLATGVAFREDNTMIPAYHAEGWKHAAPEGGAGEAVIIGSGLSAYEAALGCTETGLYRKATMISRSGIMRRVRCAITEYIPQFFTREGINRLAGGADAPIRFSHILHLLAKEINALYGSDSLFSSNEDPREILDIIRNRPAAETIAAFLEDADNCHLAKRWRGFRATIDDDFRGELFRRLIPDDLPDALRYASLFESYNSPMSTVTAARLADGFRRGRIALMKGIPEIIRDDNHNNYSVTLQGTNARTISADTVINATGFHRDIAATPLYKQLLQDGAATLHPNGGIAIDHNSFHVMKENGAAHDNLYALGHMHQGSLLISATPHLTRCGIALGKRLMETLTAS